MATPKTDFFRGVRAEIPLAAGVAPFGLIFGALASDFGIGALAAVAMSTIVFAGASQFIGARLIGTGGSPFVVIATTFIVNLRHALYAMSLAPDTRHLPRGWRALLAYLLTDEAYAPTARRYLSGSDPATRHWYFLGAGVTLWSVWQISTIAGIVLGSRVPESWALDFTVTLTFTAMLIPALTDRPRVAAALASAAVAVATVELPNRTGLLLAAFTGIATAMLLQLLAERRTPAARP